MPEIVVAAERRTESGKNANRRLRVKGLIPAWDKTIPGLKRGSRVLIIAPPEDAYGDREQPTSRPARRSPSSSTSSGWTSNPRPPLR